MKPVIVLACLITVFACTASSQTIIRAVEVSKHVGEKVFLCDKVYSLRRVDSLTTLVLGSEHPEEQLTIMIKGFNLDSNDYSKGRIVCVAGLLKNDSGKSKMEVRDPEMISVQKSVLLGRNGNKTTSLTTVKVTLSPPPPAHYFGERYKAITLSDLETVSADTIKITETISSYQLTDKTVRIDFGGIYPNQALTVFLKGNAKQYFDAMLKFEYKGQQVSEVLLGKRFMAIGAVTRIKGKPQIVIKDPDKFTIMPN